MKIYTLDCGWAGSIVVVANSKEEALAKMELEFNFSYCENVEANFKEHEINTDFVFCNTGDI